MEPYNIANDILTQKANVTLGQMLQLPRQRRNFTEIVKRPVVAMETNHIDTPITVPPSFSAAKYHIRIRGTSLLAILDSVLPQALLLKDY